MPAFESGEYEPYWWEWTVETQAGGADQGAGVCQKSQGGCWEGKFLYTMVIYLIRYPAFD